MQFIDLKAQQDHIRPQIDAAIKRIGEQEQNRITKAFLTIVP